LPHGDAKAEAALDNARRRSKAPILVFILHDSLKGG
jgi:hypothetical protein